MKRSASMPVLATAVALVLAACATPGPPAPTPETRTFANADPIAVPGGAVTSGPADPYPAPIVVADMPDVTTRVVVTLSALSHAWPDDLEVLLVGPGGQHVLLLSDAGGSADAVNATIVFDASASETVPDAGPLVAGTYRPSAYVDGDAFPAPAPVGPYVADLTVFDGTDPNGTWNLYVVDDTGADTGTIGGGWSLTITAQ